MKICVISDLHCKFRQDSTDRAETFLFSNSKRTPVNQHPVVALLYLIQNEGLTADAVICPGDLGERADEQGITSSWQFLQEISSKLSANILLGIPGNHDINSRGPEKNPFDFIQNFHENFPLANEEAKNCFWQSGYCFHLQNDILFCLVNTVKDHIDVESAQLSQVTDITLAKLKAAFEANPAYKQAALKLMVLHHHPIQHSDIKNWRGTDVVHQGDKLIQLASELGVHMVIHGHKHQPRIIDINSLPIFAAGSFSSFANINGTGISPMFHMIDFVAGGSKGTIYSWEYDVIKGWTQKLNPYFPPRIGFGERSSVEVFAENLYSSFEANGKKPMLFDDVVKSSHDIWYLQPGKLLELKKLLQEKYKLKTSPELPLDPQKIFEILN